MRVLTPVALTGDDIERMADKTLLSYGTDTWRKNSAFWVLLTLAGIIATAGVATDSTATVIGAMIVAPLMTPILGVAFALVVADRKRMLRSLAVVLLGALLVIAIGWLFAEINPFGDMTVGNSQVSGRVNPRLVDLLAALATGTVGAFALVRSDVADTLPGVAIAISLVPPLAVVGVCANEGHGSEAFGALLLFATNVTAIIFTATIVMLVAKVRPTAARHGFPVGRMTAKTLVVVSALVLVVAIPLGIGTYHVATDTWISHGVSPVTVDWAKSSGWSVNASTVQGGKLNIRVIGTGTPPSPKKLRAALDAAGYPNVEVTVTLVDAGQVVLPGSGG